MSSRNSISSFRAASLPVIVGLDPTIQTGVTRAQNANDFTADIHPKIPSYAGMTVEANGTATTISPPELHKIHKFTICNVKKVFLFTLSAL
jgi:hypothetical protein